MESNKTSSVGKLLIILVLLMLFAIWLAYDASAHIVDYLNPNTIVYYELEETSSPYVDNVGRINLTVGTVPDRDTGVINFGQDFDRGAGEELYTTSLSNLRPTDEFCVSFWYKPKTEANSQGIIGTYQETGGTSGWYVLMSSTSGNLFFSAITSGGTDNWDTGFDPDENVWHHIVCSFDSAANLQCWNNATSLGTSPASGTVDYDGDEFFYMGMRYAAAPDLQLDADLDEVAYFNTSCNQTMVNFLFNSGNVGENQQYEFESGIVNPTSINFTLVDDFNSSTIQNFSINLTWNNGTQQTYHTTTGTINLHNVSTTNHTINITYWNVTNYFSTTFRDRAINANESNAVVGRVYQSIANFQAYEKITNTLLSDVNFTVGSKNGTTVNISSGAHTVVASKTGYFDLAQSISVTALTNQTYNITGMYDAIVNFTAYNSITNATVNEFTITTSAGDNVSTTNGTITLGLINGSTYNYNITSPGLFASRLNLSFTVNQTYSTVNTSLFTFNSIQINIYNETSGELLTQQVTIDVLCQTLNTTQRNTTSTGFISLQLIQPNDYEIRFSSSGFNPRSLFITVTNDSTQNASVYMTQNLTTELQRIEVLNTANQPVEGAIVWLQKEQLNSTERWITIQESETDYSGKTTVWVEKDVTVYYRFAVIYDGEAKPIQPSNNLFTGKTNFIPGVDETIQLIIDLEESPTDFLSDQLAISENCSIMNVTVSCLIVDGRNSIVGGKLVIEASYINESLNYETIATLTFNGSTGVLEYNITPVNDSIWRATAYAVYSNSETMLWQDTKQFALDVMVDKNTGMWYAVLVLAVVFALTVTWGALPSSIVGVAALAGLSYIKLISIPTGVITGFIALAVIFFYRTRKLEE